MNIRRAALTGVFFVASLLGAAEPSIEFSGVLTAEGKTQVALTDTARKSTTWVKTGDEFNGYTVARYDAKEDAVFLKKGGQEIRLGLVTARTVEPQPTAATRSAALAESTAAAIRANLRQLASAARQYQIASNATSVSFSDLVGPGKLIREIKPVAGENYSTLTFGSNVTGVSVTTATGATVGLDLPPVPGAAATAAAPIAPATTSPAPSSAPAPTRAIVTVTTVAPPVTTSAPGAFEPTGRQPASPSYSIQGGDTWQSISAKTGVPVQQLRQLNPVILEGSPLPAGQTIKLR